MRVVRLAVPVVAGAVVLLGSSSASAANPIHWTSTSHGWTLDPYFKKDSQGRSKARWRCTPKSKRGNGSVCETFDRGKTWGLAFANYDPSSDCRCYWNYTYTFVRTSSRDAVVSGGNGGNYEFWTNNNGLVWNETDVFNVPPNPPGGCISWPDYCTTVNFIALTHASAAFFGGRPGGLAFSTLLPQQTTVGELRYDDAVFRLDGWPVRGSSGESRLHPVRLW
ncbi:MAG: hypothetical protein H0W87_04365 [Actinobacteria bacterium]|nr:hypothetical protein [Actinomycetota bacterium]